jgi:Na+-translocating ferredoxin:NAD+ oxidoreductase subunit E
MNTEKKKSGFFEKNPVLGSAIGLCPALAVTTDLTKSLVLGCIVIFVLTMSNAVVSITKNLIPYKVRIPCYLVIISSFVTVASIILSAVSPAMSAALGIFVPLTAVNCIIIGRAEAFASKNKVVASIVDGGSQGFQFTSALVLCALIREALGKNSLFGVPLIPHVQPLHALSLSCGGFFVLAFILGIANHIRIQRIARSTAPVQVLKK